MLIASTAGETSGSPAGLLFAPVNRRAEGVDRGKAAREGLQCENTTVAFTAEVCLRCQGKKV